ncbi:hypothetical protein Tco_0887604 [Tanacetum coccineum]
MRFAFRSLEIQEFLARQGLDQAFFESINKDPFSGLQWVNLFQISENVYRELVREFFASFEFDAYPYRYDPNHLDVRESATLSGLRKGVTVKANHLLLGFWSTIGDGGFIIGNTKVEEEDEEDDEANEAAGGDAGNEGAGGSADMYRNISQEERANWMYSYTVRQLQYMSTSDNLDPHLQIDPFPGREADYPPYGYICHMPPGNEY